MSTGKSWAIFSIIRVALFAVPCALLMLIGAPMWLAAILAGIIGLALSVIFLQRRREQASTSIYDWRMKDRTHDDIVEDELADAKEELQQATSVDAAEATASEAASPSASDAAQSEAPEAVEAESAVAEVIAPDSAGTASAASPESPSESPSENAR